MYAIGLKKNDILREISAAATVVLSNDDRNRTQESNNQSKNPGDEESPMPFNNRDFPSQESIYHQRSRGIEVNLIGLLAG